MENLRGRGIPVNKVTAWSDNCAGQFKCGDFALLVNHMLKEHAVDLVWCNTVANHGKGWSDAVTGRIVALLNEGARKGERAGGWDGTWAAKAIAYLNSLPGFNTPSDSEFATSPEQQAKEIAAAAAEGKTKVFVQASWRGGSAGLGGAAFRSKGIPGRISFAWVVDF